MRNYQRSPAENAESIGTFKTRQQSAFEAERKRWEESGQLNFPADADMATITEELAIPAGCTSLPNTQPPKLGLIRVDTEGAAIEVEVWELANEAFGAFVAAVPSPLCIGTIELANSRTVKGFLCEPIGTKGAWDITDFGGWRAFLKRPV